MQPIIRDEAVRLAPEGQLVGILSRRSDPGEPSAPRAHIGAGLSAFAVAGPRAPASQLPGASAPTSTPDLTDELGFVILNAGVLHRVGPHRLHVTLARRIAASGVTSLRLDLGGIGDSVASSDATNFRDSAVADTRAALTGMAELSPARKFVLFGVCAGADNSLATALADDRVAGVVLVDPAVYPTSASQLRYLRQKLAEQGGARAILRWGAKVVERRARLALSTLGRRGDASNDEAQSAGRELPPPGAFGAQLTRLVERGIRVLAIYSGIHGPRYNHVDQIFEVFPALRGKIDRAYFPTANHTFTELGAQAELIDTVAGWMTHRFG